MFRPIFEAAHGEEPTVVTCFGNTCSEKVAVLCCGTACTKITSKRGQGNMNSGLIPEFLDVGLLRRPIGDVGSLPGDAPGLAGGKHHFIIICWPGVVVSAPREAFSA